MLLCNRTVNDRSRDCLKQQIVGSLSDLDRLESAVIASAEATIGMLKELLNSTSAFNALALLKFGEIDRDPLDSTRPLNIVEQLNQSACRGVPGGNPSAGGRQTRPVEHAEQTFLEK